MCPNTQGTQFSFLAVLDLATMYNLIFVCDHTKPSYVRKLFKDNGITWAGIPEQMAVDNGSAFGAEFLTYTSDNDIYHHGSPVEAPWQHGMVERHGPVLAGLVHAITAETRVVGEQQMQDALRMTSLANHRRLGSTGYSPRALVYRHDEKCLASGLHHYLEKPDGAVMTRQDPCTCTKHELPKTGAQGSA